MKLENLDEIMILFDYYKNLLSEKQKSYIEEHFENDYSLSEIAEKYNISRQAVSDNINRSIKILKEYEKNLGFFQRDKIIKEKLNFILKNNDVEKIKEVIKLLEA